MEEIKVGEYVRDTEGEIYKADKIFLNHANVEIKKHSFNIIDLIEEGDYVNGDKIVKIEEDIYIGGLNLWTERNAPDGFGGFYRVKYREKDIKSIVTKEQFKAMEYEVK